MKKLLIAVLAVAALSYAGVCDSWSYTNAVNDFPPRSNGKHYLISQTDKYSNGNPILIGLSLSMDNWYRSFWGKAHNISCTVDDIEGKSGYTYGELKSCYLITLDCSVEERLQFYSAGVTYYQLSGYRNDGTLLWSRNEAGSTDIYCYDKSGMHATKRVNDPYYCK